MAASLRPQAKVFITARRWVRLGDSVFWNDLGIADRDLLEADEDALLATPGHLGDDDESRGQTCDLLGLERATTRYRLETQRVIAGVTTPETWKLGFERAQGQFWNQLSGTDDATGGNERPGPLELVCVGEINRRLLKDDVEIDLFDSTVAIAGVQAYAVGEPLEFAPDLAQALIEHWGITLRRDGYALGSRLTGLLVRIDRMPEDVEPPEPPDPPEPPNPPNPPEPPNPPNPPNPPKPKHQGSVRI